MRYLAILVFVLFAWAAHAQNPGTPSFASVNNTAMLAGVDNTGATDVTAKIQAAIATGKQVHLPAGSFHITNSITLGAGQCLYGDGANETLLTVSNDFNSSATAVLIGSGSDPSICLHDIGVSFNQPTTLTSRASMTTLAAGCTVSGGSPTGCKYPWALYASNNTRARIWNVRVSGAWDGFQFVGNDGGMWLDNIEMGALDNGLDLNATSGASLDVCHIQGWHSAPFGFFSGTTLTDIYEDGNTYAAKIGECDGLQIHDFLSFDGQILLTSTFWGATIDGLDLDGTYAALTDQGPSTSYLNISGWYHTANLVGSTPPSITVSSGNVTASDGWWWGYSVGAPAILVNGGNVNLGPTTFLIQGQETSTTPFLSVTSGTLVARGLDFEMQAGTYASPIVAQSSTGVLDFRANKFSQIGSSSGTAVSVAADVAGNAVTNNDLGGWATSLPTTNTGEYGPNNGVFTSPVTINTGSTAENASLAVTNSGASGAGILLTGNGSTTPSKTIRVDAGQLQIVNSAFSSVIASLTDAGVFATTGGISSTNGLFSGELSLAASATGGATLNLPQGAAPTSPNNGDIWTTSGGLYVRIAGSTVGPLGSGGGGGITALTGDVTASGSGSVSATVAKINGVSISLGGGFTTSGSYTTTLTTTGNTTLTLPTSGTLATTANINTALPSATTSQIYQGSASAGAATAATVSGDCTIAAGGAMTCLKTNGTSFGTAATANTATILPSATTSQLYGGSGAAGAAAAVSLASNLAISGSTLSGPGKFTVFTSSGTWTKAATSTHVEVEGWGGAGGGGAGYVGATSTATGGGGGGGGAARRVATFRASDLPSTVTVTIGAAGTGASTSGGNGTAGTNTTFGSYLTAPAGGGGGGGGTAGSGGGGPGAAYYAGFSASGATPGTGVFSNGATGSSVSQNGIASAAGGAGSPAGGAGGIGGFAEDSGSGGSAGGGVTAGNVSEAGGGGQDGNFGQTAGGTAGGGAGAAWGSFTYGNTTSGGGAGGGGNTTGNGGNGAAGQTPGGGGGGGGSTQTGHTQGSGGNGGGGLLIVREW